MDPIFHRNPAHDYPVAVAGDGAWIIDAQGRRYLDACGGAAVSCLGHSDHDVAAAMRAQLERIAYTHTSFFTSEPAEQLAGLLVAGAPGMGRAYFVSSGSEAMEGALKLARQVWLDRGEPQRTRVVARRQSYHGNTLGALAVGGNMARRAQYEPLLFDVTHVSPCYSYRDRRDGEDDEAYGQRLLAELEQAFEQLGPRNVMAFVAETVVGATLGSVPPVPGYLRGVRERCDRHGILLVLDEVMCGMGRCGSLHAYEAEGVQPDILTLGKGLAAGYQPLAAFLCSAQIYEDVVRGSGAFQHGHTYTGHALACAAGLAVQRAIASRGLVARVAQSGALFERMLRERFGAHPAVGDIRGRGLFWSLELVADRGTKAAFDPSRRVHAALKAEALSRGLMCYPMGGTIDGTRGDHVLLAPPYIATGDELAQCVERLGAALDAVLS